MRTKYKEGINERKIDDQWELKTKLKREYWIQVRLLCQSAKGRSSVVEVPGKWAVKVSLDSCAGLDNEAGAGTRIGVVHRV